MIYTIYNEAVSVSVDSFGAQLCSVLTAGGTEYLWQGDERYWKDRSPVLFPYIARLYNNSYTYKGKLWQMGIHGFAADCAFRAESVNKDSVSFVLTENDSTLSQYPFRFMLKVTYTLSGCGLIVSYDVENRDENPMPFALGGHPGFNVPFADGSDFEDYCLCFDEACEPVRVGFTEALFLSGESEPYPLEDSRIIRLSHSLFDRDAVILSKTAKSVTLSCDKSGRSLTISFPDFDYFGIWHVPGKNAPYVCLEPWTSLPSRQGVIEDVLEKKDMIILAPGEHCSKQWSISISEVK